MAIADPQAIRERSSGEVTSSEVIAGKSIKPAKNGLFCEDIFGRVDGARLFMWESNWELADWECQCRAYRGIEYRGTVCNKCNTEVTSPVLRRDRWGHIELAEPVSHVWFLKGQPSSISQLLDRRVEDIESVVRHEKHIVTNPGDTPLELNAILAEKELLESIAHYGEKTFTVETGGQAIQRALSLVDLPAAMLRLTERLGNTRSPDVQKSLARRLQLIRAFVTSKVKPEWMMLTALPVLPPGLRPIIPLAGGNFSEGDINHFYGKIILVNERLKEMLGNRLCPNDIIQAEKRTLQKAVDALFENGHHGLAYTNRWTRQLRKSLAKNLGGKEGRFRQNLLGKRVDFSGRSVIVVGPELKLHQCGLPKEMALVLFEPFLIHRLKKLKLVETTPEGKKWIKRQPTEIWDLLEEILRERLVLLNRAPTLHRLSIQAFEPILVEGQAIRLHPLVCTAYNADFDGDQMAVHVPLSDAAMQEARHLMMATSNVLSPASGKSIITPSQDIVLGCYYLTVEPTKPAPANIDELPLFGSPEEALAVSGYWSVKSLGRKLTTHDQIRLANPDYGRQTAWGSATEKTLVTTVGRVMFNEIWPAELGFHNEPVKKEDLSDMIGECYKLSGSVKTVTILDKLKDLGFQAATRAGISIGIDDMRVPAQKEGVIEAAKTKVKNAENYFRDGIITAGERKEISQYLWQRCFNQMKTLVKDTLKDNQTEEQVNPLWLMLNSGARGNLQQIVQLTGMRGLMVKANGEIMEKPILANFREGLTALEFFSSCHGARKGTCDTSLKTANAGHLTRKLVSVATDVVITAQDCGTLEGCERVMVRQKDESRDKFTRRVRFVFLGRVAMDAIVSDLGSAKVLVAAGAEINEAAVVALAQADEVRVKIRTVLTCESRRGVCAWCYGHDLATGKMATVGTAVGVIAAQSIGEPGTQLTMRTFHTGGVASDNDDITGGLPRVNALFEAHRPKPAAAFTRIGGAVSLELNARGESLLMVTNSAGDREGHKVLPKARIIVSFGDRVLPGRRLTEGATDPHEIVAAFGPVKFMEQLVDEVQRIFQIQGVNIHPKHFEIIARQMLSKVRITESGDTILHRGQEVDRSDFLEQNEWVNAKGRQPAEAKPILLGITQVAQRTKSFLSAASFQYTRKTLTEAAVLSQRDDLLGMKEKVMTGGLIPAGTGFKQ